VSRRSVQTRDVLPGCASLSYCVRVKPDTSWPERLNAVTGGRVRYYRRRNDLTAGQLSDRCADLGLPMSRSKLANLENGRARQEGVGVAEVLVLAAALGVPPALLVFPLGSHDDVEVLPGCATDAWTAYRWLTGEARRSALPGDAEPVDTLGEALHVLDAYGRHTTALLRYLMARQLGGKEHEEAEEALTALVEVRQEIRRMNWRLPPVREDVAADVRAADVRAANVRAVEDATAELTEGVPR
jgi:transcriptional regulator with XRE-family HTH domain